MKKKILIIDDEPNLGELIKLALDGSEYQVSLASNGQEGLDIAHNQDFSLIVTDVLMPVMDGLDFCEEIKREKETARIPVIVFTALPNMESSFKDLGVTDFLAKPFDVQILLEKIRHVLRQAIGVKKHIKVLMGGEDIEIVQGIINQLQEDGWKGKLEIDMADDPQELIQKALTSDPDIVLIDVFMGGFPANDIITEMRKQSLLRDTNILTYNNFKGEELEDSSVSYRLREAQMACLRAGASHYMGALNKFSFAASLYECC